MLILPQGIPCAEILRSAHHSIHEVPLGARVPNATTLLLLNLMPEKAACELQIARMLAPVAKDIDLQVIPIKIPGQTYKTTPMSHMEAFYEDFVPQSELHADRLIITGAPLENVAYPDVRYWRELCAIFDWAACGGADWTLNLCWAGFAALWYFDQVPTHHLESKQFGVFRYDAQDIPVLHTMHPHFMMPVSRHIEIRREDLTLCPHLQLAADSPVAGPGVVVDADRRMTHKLGHLEYEAGRLDFEYKRDLSKGMAIAEPQNYYNHNTEEGGSIDFSWEAAAKAFYRNFITPPVS